MMNWLIPRHRIAKAGGKPADTREEAFLIPKKEGKQKTRTFAGERAGP